ncbi:hypothetical protein GLAREA_12454 [Glarea lozoyensis ATCC 20868]|uniref:Uncharacterized protein n=1 Tax=Glarea lozoyensis (strain ATCC 20868 / MF5171) TaxID=1116229 RepID=S3DZE7_GLAL2|nr:uncharacterized protein GLAREA_12454 [Glarea lozoyensis ATCC 20868]EPE31698.1 hypothetical protein GLAREA_12454 [Glarea lozoyensis ATCC 20868]
MESRDMKPAPWTYHHISEVPHMIDGRWPGKVERSMDHLYEATCDAYQIYDDMNNDAWDDGRLPRHYTVPEIIQMTERVEEAINVLKRACKHPMPSEQHFISEAHVLIQEAYETRCQLFLLAGIDAIRELRQKRKIARKERKDPLKRAMARRAEYGLGPETGRQVLDAIIQERQETERRTRVFDGLIGRARQEGQEVHRRPQESQEEIQERLRRRARVLDIIHTARANVMLILSHNERAMPQCKGGRRRMNRAAPMLTSETADVFMKSVHVVVLALELLSGRERDEEIRAFLREYQASGSTILRSLNLLYGQCRALLGEDVPPVPAYYSNREESSSSGGESASMGHDFVLPVEWRTDQSGVPFNTARRR